jgi:hypothetical protein
MGPKKGERMTSSFDPEVVDLARLASILRARCGGRVEGSVVGRTVLRDAVSEHLQCSQLDAENIVDTMIGRGFIVRSHVPDGPEAWLIEVPSV